MWWRERLSSLTLALALCVGAPAAAGCGGDDEPDEPAVDAEEQRLPIDELPYAQEVVSFKPGAGAGYGQDRFPGVVLGPPDGKGELAGSLDVLSLGVGGELILGFGDRAVVDGPGPDLVVFENPFWFKGQPAEVFAELGRVSVSEDGERWFSFGCDVEAEAPGRWPGCAGWSPTLAYDGWNLTQVSFAQTGGDGFDLADVGLSRARFVKIEDLSQDGAPPSAGFDLDAVGLIHYE